MQTHTHTYVEFHPIVRAITRVEKKQAIVFFKVSAIFIVSFPFQRDIKYSLFLKAQIEKVSSIDRCVNLH